jgi:hypothetical protein
MSLLDQSIIKHKMGLLNLAEELSNVSQACRVMGVSCDTFYRVKEAKENGGMEALLHTSRRRPNPKNRMDPAVEEAVLAYAWKIRPPVRFEFPTSSARRAFSLVRAAYAPCGCAPLERCCTSAFQPANLQHFAWQSDCSGLFHTPIAA